MAFTSARACPISAAMRCSRLAPDALCADDDVVEVAFLHDRGSIVPEVLEEDGVDPVVAVRANPAQLGLLRLERSVDPQLEDAVRLSRVVQLRVRFDTVPLASARGLEERPRRLSGAEPA